MKSKIGQVFLDALFGDFCFILFMENDVFGENMKSSKFNRRDTRTLSNGRSETFHFIDYRATLLTFPRFKRGKAKFSYYTNSDPPDIIFDRFSFSKKRLKNFRAI